MATVNSTKHGHRFIDLTGKTFNRWTVIEFYSVDKGRKIRWLCRCECGKEKPVLAGSLRDGSSTQCKSCGLTTHGQSDKPEQWAWGGMLRRCYRSTNPSYCDYGGRGIVVCEHWRTFANFLADMGDRPSAKHSIDRINNDGNYSCGHCPECLRKGWPANCRWATKTQQQRNRRSARLLTHNGQTMCVTEWAEKTGIVRDVLYMRLRAGWSAKRALTTPVRSQKCRVQ